MYLELRGDLVRYLIFILFILVHSKAFTAATEDFPFDEEDSSIDQIEKGLSQKEGLSESEKTKDDSDKFSIGGSIRNDITLYQFEEKVRDDYFRDPTILSLYLDNKFTDDFRFFFRGQVSYDGTIGSSTSVNPFTSTKEESTNSQLDELKIQFSIVKALFVSLGVQKIKWGSGKFWNPSDFLNQEAKSLVEKEDRRAGLHLAKFHLPIGESNFYYITKFDDESNEIQDSGHALRFETPLPKFLTIGEVSLSYYGKRNQVGRGAGDLSIALGPFDFYFEGSLEKQKEHTSFVSGVSYEWQYSDKDTMILSLESFANPGGVSSTDEYLGLILAKRFVPFYVAQRYYAASLYLPQPWSLNHTDLSFMIIQNQLDQSQYLRFGYTWTGYKAINASLFMGMRVGSEESEFKLGGLTNDYMLRVEYKF